MENSSFFTKIKKLNTIIFSLIGITLLIFLCGILYNNWLISGPSKRHSSVDVAPAVQNEDTKEILTLSAPSPVKGTEIFIASLKSNQKYTSSYSSKRGSSATMRNILFTNMQDETTNWLFPKNSFIIPHFQLISDEKKGRKTPSAIFYRVVKEDTNNDAKLSPKDKLTLALSEIDGSRYTEIFTDIDSVSGQHVINEKTFAISFTQDNNSYLSYVDLERFEVTKKLLLPNINQGTP